MLTVTHTGNLHQLRLGDVVLATMDDDEATMLAIMLLDARAWRQMYNKFLGGCEIAVTDAILTIINDGIVALIIEARDGTTTTEILDTPAVNRLVDELTD